MYVKYFHIAVLYESILYKNEKCIITKPSFMVSSELGSGVLVSLLALTPCVFAMV